MAAKQVPGLSMTTEEIAIMHPWNKEALKSMRQELGGVNMGVVMIKKLEKSDVPSPAYPTLGFLSREQLQVVESINTLAGQMNKVIDYLLEMEDKYFDDFCTILEQSNFEGKAKRLREKAKVCKRHFDESCLRKRPPASAIQDQPRAKRVVRSALKGSEESVEAVGVSSSAQVVSRGAVAAERSPPICEEVSFAILTANKREELAVNGFLGLDCVDHASYPHASKLQYSSDAVLKDAKAKVVPLPDPRYTHRLFSLEVNGSKQVGVHVYCDKIGPWGAFHKTVELLKTARDENWKLRYIFIVGCCGASVKEAKKKDFPRGTILLAEQVKDYLNTGKVEEECEEDIAEEIVSGKAPTFKVKGSPTTYQMNSTLLTQMIGVQKRDTCSSFNKIEVKKVDYLSGPLVIKSSLFGATFRDSSVDACGVEMEAVGVLKAVETFQTISGGPKAEVVLAKGISDYTGRKGESGSCKFFDEMIKDATDDQLQVNATMQAIALVIRFVAIKIEWLFNQRPLKY